MDTEAIVRCCLNYPEAYADRPFGQWPICIRLRGKIFAQVYPHMLTLKCTAFSAQAFRESYPGIVLRGYHCPPVQQPYWNTIDLTRFPHEELPMMIDHAYETVLHSLPKRVQREISAAQPDVAP